MKNWIFILAILALIIVVSRCTTIQSPPANKTYSVNGLSFIYPGYWSELDKTAYQSDLMIKVNYWQCGAMDLMCLVLSGLIKSRTR
ncbi:hypothetical protein [Methanobacterium sp.]|uniref:hypothetical protein n=1 Tax=Methanobacterium sp. TaxID=2164 RepID=UPI003C749C42